MFASPLIKTLQMLTPEELETLHLFVASPIFNNIRAEETLALFEYIKPFYPGFDAPELHRDKAGAHFFHKNSNPVGALQRTMTQLMAILRQFITMRYELLRDTGKSGDSGALLLEVQQKLSLMRFYSERMQSEQRAGSSGTEKGRKNRKAENYFDNLNNQARKEMDQQTDFSQFDENNFGDFYLFRYVIEQEKAFYEEQNSERDGDKNLLAATEHLDTYYLLSKLDQMCRLVHYQRMWQLYEDGSPELIRFQTNRQTTIQIVGALREYGFLQQPAIALYCTLLDFLTQTDLKTAERLSDEIEAMLTEHPHVLPAMRIKSFRVMLRGYWPARYRETRDVRFLEKIFSMQLRQLEMLNPGESLPSTHFLNILNTALKLKKTEWVEQFYQDFRHRLTGLEDEDQRTLLLDICKAAILFGKNDLKAAADAMPHYLTYGAVDDIYLYAIAATLDTRIRYDLDDLDGEYAERMMHATTTRLRRDDTLPPGRRSERLRFFPLAKELFKLKIQRSQDKKADLTSAIAKIRQKLDAEIVVDWEWLQEKVAAFEKAPAGK